ncbi:hypothetical protein JL722_12970 [Aureococcus anophagefferens]|nr:hypothetical protein JL722_12970 [Aureococcus anophagefferens]
MERGHALNLYAHPKEPKLVYCFGKYVVARNLNDSGDNFVYRGHKYDVGAAAFSPNGYWVASGDAGGFLRLSWDNPSTPQGRGPGLAGAIKDLQWTASAHLWDVGAKSLVATKAMGADVADMQMAAVWVHGQAMSVSLSGDVNYLDEALNATKVAQAPQAPVSAMAVVGSTIVAGCNDGTVTAAAAFGGGFATAGFDDTVRFCDGAAYDAEVKVDGQPAASGAWRHNAAAGDDEGPRDRGPWRDLRGRRQVRGRGLGRDGVTRRPTGPSSPSA